MINNCVVTLTIISIIQRFPLCARQVPREPRCSVFAELQICHIVTIWKSVAKDLKDSFINTSKDKNKNKEAGETLLMLEKTLLSLQLQLKSL